MQDGPVIAGIASLLGDPARANMLVALMDGRALTVSELAVCAGVALPTASGHLARLAHAGLVVPVRQGRHRFFRLSGEDVAAAIELLMGIAERTGAQRVRTGPGDAAMREARVCYDHLAGARAVALADQMIAMGHVADDVLSEEGRAFFAGLGIEVEASGRRPVCRSCLDWSERRNHLAGVLGAAILDHVLNAGWAARGEGRVLRFSAAGAAAFDRAFALA